MKNCHFVHKSVLHARPSSWNLDAARAARLFGVSLQRLGGRVFEVALDAKPPGASDGSDFRKADVVELRKAHAEVAQVESNVRVFGGKLGQKPDGFAPRAEKLHDG
jgi:hypothetical protein